MEFAHSPSPLFFESCRSLLCQTRKFNCSKALETIIHEVRAKSQKLDSHIFFRRVSNLFSDNIGIQIVTGAAESGNTEILRWATSKNHPSDSNNPCEIPYVHKPAGVSKLAQKQAARFGHLDVLKILKQNRQTMCSGTLNVAASRGDVEMVDWLLSCGVEVGDQASLDAAMAGHFELAKKLIVADTSIRSLLLTAAAKGSLDFLEWLVTKFNYEVSENFTDVAIAAFAGPQMNILEWMVNTGWVCSEEDCNEAANTGNIELVQFTINNGASFNVKTMNAAASHGHLHLVKWLRENGCPWSMKTTRLAAYEGNLETLQWLLQNGCPYDMHSVAKIEAGRLICNQKFRVLKFLSKYGIQLDSSLYVDAISVQNVQFLNYLYDNNLALSAELWWYALQSSSMTALKWLTAKNCPWDSDIFHLGWLNIKALKWIQKNGFELSVQPSINAATIEEISVLKWLKENGWPFSLETTQAAAIQNKYKSFKWLVESGCPVDLELCNRLTLSHEIQFFINNKS